MKKTIEIEGMSCNHCKMTAEKFLGKIQDVTSVEVDLEKKLATVLSDSEISDQQLIDAVEEAGFTPKIIY